MKNVEQKYPWSFLGFVTGIIFGGIGIYTVFFYNRSPDLLAELVGEAPVFNLNQEVADLVVTFRGTDVREATQELTLFSVRLENQGNAPIRANDFDPKDPLTITLSEGEIVKVELPGSSADYLKNVLSNAEVHPASVRLPAFIMEPGESMTLQFLVLHGKSAQPSFSGSGKIAGVSEPVKIRRMSGTTGRNTISATGGDIVVQFKRVVIYGPLSLVVLLVLVILGALISKISRILKKKSRLRALEKGIIQFIENGPPAPSSFMSRGPAIAKMIVSEADYLANTNDKDFHLVLSDLDLPIPKEELREDSDLVIALRSLVRATLHPVYPGYPPRWR